MNNVDNAASPKSWVQRNGFSHAAMGMLWVIAAFILFQVLAGVAAVGVILLRMGVSGLSEASAMSQSQLMGDNLDIVFFANSLGQIFFLGLSTWWFTLLHTSKTERRSFLRLNHDETLSTSLVLAAVLIVAVQPAIWFLGWLNAFVPAPEVFKNMQLQQMEMIEQFLGNDGALWIALFNIALVPAICEEVLFRGYLMRALQKSWGITAAIIVSGCIFGIYHLQITNFLPLATIGIVLAVLTWTTRSLYPAMLAHFINNGTGIILGTYFPDEQFAEMSASTMPPIWLTVASVVISAYLIRLMIRRKITTSEAVPL